MTVIALIGAAGSGKDSVANHIISEYDAGKVSVAYPLKMLCIEQFGWDPALLFHEDPAVSLAYKEDQDPNLPYGWTRRRVLQHVGEKFREIDPDHWVRPMLDAVEGTLCVVDTVLISDVRFRNEVEGLQERFDAATVRVVCSDRATQTDAADHVSETELANYEAHYTLSAKFGHLPVLYAQASDLATQLGCAFRCTLGCVHE